MRRRTDADTGTVAKPKRYSDHHHDGDANGHSNVIRHRNADSDLVVDSDGDRHAERDANLRDNNANCDPIANAHSVANAARGGMPAEPRTARP